MGAEWNDREPYLNQWSSETAWAQRYENGTSGFGNCRATAQAFGDLDGDGAFSTFERSLACDKVGCSAAGGLYIDRESE